jgi:hypothetical protein
LRAKPNETKKENENDMPTMSRNIHGPWPQQGRPKEQARDYASAAGRDAKSAAEK